MKKSGKSVTYKLFTPLIKDSIVGKCIKLFTSQINKIGENKVYKLFTRVIKDFVVRKQFLISYFNVSTQLLVNLLTGRVLRYFKPRFLGFVGQIQLKIVSILVAQAWRTLLKVVEELLPISQNFEIDSERLKLFTTNLKYFAAYLLLTIKNFLLTIVFLF